MSFNGPLSSEDTATLKKPQKILNSKCFLVTPSHLTSGHLLFGHLNLPYEHLVFGQKSFGNLTVLTFALWIFDLITSGY